MLGKWQVEGLAIATMGKRYAAIVRLSAPNDFFPQGERQSLHLLWCPCSGVPEEPQKSMKVVMVVMVVIDVIVMV